MNINKDKIEKGIFYTKCNPFKNKVFKKWFKENKLENKIITEPFAGNGDIIRHLNKIGISNKHKMYDINSYDNIIQNNSFENFPKNNELIITNPPWLSKAVAKRKNINYYNNKYDNLYKFSLDLCIRNSKYVAILLPSTYLQTELFFNHLNYYINITHKLFLDTEQPTCLCLFSNKVSDDFSIYENEKYIGKYNEFKNQLFKNKNEDNNKIKFNSPDGNLGFISFDNTRKDTIRFINPDEIKREIKASDRMITKIKIDINVDDNLIMKLNNEIKEFRSKTKDIFLTTFKGLRTDGKYRRRMNYNIARKLIEKYI